MREAARGGSQQEHGFIAVVKRVLLVASSARRRQSDCSASVRCLQLACTREMVLDVFTAMNSDEDWLNAAFFAAIALLQAAVQPQFGESDAC